MCGRHDDVACEANVMTWHLGRNSRRVERRCGGEGVLCDADSLEGGVALTQHATKASLVENCGVE